MYKYQIEHQDGRGGKAVREIVSRRPLASVQDAENESAIRYTDDPFGEAWKDIGIITGVCPVPDSLPAVTEWPANLIVARRDGTEMEIRASSMDDALHSVFRAGFCRNSPVARVYDSATGCRPLRAGTGVKLVGSGHTKPNLRIVANNETWTLAATDSAERRVFPAHWSVWAEDMIYPVLDLKQVERDGLQYVTGTYPSRVERKAAQALSAGQTAVWRQAASHNLAMDSSVLYLTEERAKKYGFMPGARAGNPHGPFHVVW